MFLSARSLALFAIFCCSFYLCLSFDAYAQDNQLSNVDVYNDINESHVELATKLLRNELNKIKKASGEEPKVYARIVDFRGQDGKQMLFSIVEGKGACAWRGCSTYVLVKKSTNDKWQWGLKTFASDFWIDTRQQRTDFPRVVTQAPTMPVVYWLWDERMYRSAANGGL